MSHSRMTRYLIAIPFLVVFLLMLVLSSNAKADTDDMTMAVELSYIDTSSSMHHANPEPTSSAIENADLDKDSNQVVLRANKALQVQADVQSRDHISIVDAKDEDNRFTYLDVSLFDYSRVNLTAGLDSVWSKAMLVKEEPKNETGGNPWIEVFEDWGENSEDNDRENEPRIEQRPPQWLLDEAARTYGDCQKENTILDEHANTEIVLDQKVRTDRTRYEFRKNDIFGTQPNDRPPSFAKTETREKGTDTQSRENERIVLVDPVPKLPLPMFSRIANPMANGSIRGEILEFIRANPGEHMSKIKRKFSLSTSSAVHHLAVLERSGLVLAHKDGKFKRYFANENGYRSTIDGEYKAIFSVLKNTNSRQIAMHLISNPHSTLSEVSLATGLNPSTIHWHAERMEDVNIISKSRDGKNVRYFIEHTEIVEKVIALLNT